MAMATDYFNQQFDQILSNPDQFAAAEQLRKLQRLGDYMAAQQLPAQARIAAENRINSQPGFVGATWQAQNELNNMQALHPDASEQAVAAHFVDPWALAAAAGSPRSAPGGGGRGPSVRPEQGAAAAHVPVGVGSVNGQPVFYPYAGQVQGYQDEMQRLGLNPGEINVPQNGLTLQDYMAAAAGREAEQKRQMAMGDAKVLAAQEGARGRIVSAERRADGLIQAQILENDGRIRTAVLNNEGREVVANITQGGLNKRNEANQDRYDRRAQERNLTTTNNTRAKMGLPPVSELPGAGGGGGVLQGLMSAAAGFIPQVPQLPQAAALQPNNAAMGMGMSQGGGGSYDPRVQAMIDQAPPYVRAKIDRVSPQSWAAFQRLPVNEQIAEMERLYSGKPVGR